MNDLSSMVRHYVSQLASSDADDACHSLLELGPVALPHLQEAFRLTHNGIIRVRLAQVACHSRSIAALPFLSELLDDGDAEIWKCALDGLVYLGWGEPSVRSQVLDM